MSESWQTGTPEQEGWFECEYEYKQGLNPQETALWWSGQNWVISRNHRVVFACTVLRFRGPLALAPDNTAEINQAYEAGYKACLERHPAKEPSQTAREAAHLLWANYSGYAKDKFIENAIGIITAAEQSAREEGKEEGRREGLGDARYIKEVAEVANKIYDLDGCCHWETVIEAMEREHNELIALRRTYADPPAQPAELTEDQQRLAKRVKQAIDDYELGRKAGKEEGRREERVRCVEICYNERREYEANATKCYKTGNSFGGTSDTIGALTCTRIAEEILATDPPAQPAATPVSPAMIALAGLADLEQRVERLEQGK